MSSAVWVGKKQLNKKKNEVLVKKGALQVSSVVWVGEKQLGREDGWGTGDKRSG